MGCGFETAFELFSFASFVMRAYMFYVLKLHADLVYLHVLRISLMFSPRSVASAIASRSGVLLGIPFDPDALSLQN